MTPAMESIGVFATAPSTGAAGTVLTGNSLTVRDTDGPAYIVAVSSVRQTAGLFRLTSPLLHDTSVGIDTSTPGAVGVSTLVPPTVQRVRGQDVISTLISGSATAGDIESSSFTVFYESLPGVAGHFIDWNQLKASAAELYVVPVSLTAVATGQYGTAAAINANNDQFKANQDYAVLGVMSQAALSTQTLGYRLVSSEWGNLGVLCANEPLGHGPSGQYFVRLSRLTGLPTIPVFNSAVRGTTTIQIQGSENSADHVVSVVLARLSQAKTGPKKR